MALGICSNAVPSVEHAEAASRLAMQVGLFLSPCSRGVDSTLSLWHGHTSSSASRQWGGWRRLQLWASGSAALVSPSTALSMQMVCPCRQIGFIHGQSVMLADVSWQEAACISTCHNVF